MLPKKHLSGSQKRKRKRVEDQFIESQKGAIHKFFSVEEQGQQHQQVNDNLSEQVDDIDDATENENL